MENKIIQKMLEDRVLSDIRLAKIRPDVLSRRDLLNKILGFLSCYLWVDGDQKFYQDKTDEVIHLLVYGIDEDDQDQEDD